MSFLARPFQALGHALALGWRQFLSWRYMRCRLVNLISVGGVMVGVAVLIVVVSVMDGFQERVRRVTRGNLADLTLIPWAPPRAEGFEPEVPVGDLPLPGSEPIPAPGNPPGPDASDPGGMEGDLLPQPAEPTAEDKPRTAPPFAQVQEVLPRLEPRVKALSPILELPVGYFPESASGVALGGLQVDGRNLLLLQAFGIDWAQETQVSTLRRQLRMAWDPKRPFHEPRAEAHDRVPVIVSWQFCWEFLGSRTKEDLRAVIGQDLALNVLLPSEDGSYRQGGYNAIISAVYEGEDTTESRTRIYLPIERVRRLANLPVEYQHIRVRLAPGSDVDGIRQALREKLPDFHVATWEDQRRDFLQAVESEKVLLMVVLSFIILLGGFTILATLTLTVIEKTRDIGILAALGATRGGILSVFVWTGLWVGILGALLGVLLGWWFTDNVDGVREWVRVTFGVDIFPPSVYRFRTIPTIWDWPTVWRIALGAVCVAFVAGLIPAWRAARQDPIKALRHE